MLSSDADADVEVKRYFDAGSGLGLVDRAMSGDAAWVSAWVAVAYAVRRAWASSYDAARGWLRC